MHVRDCFVVLSVIACASSAIAADNPLIGKWEIVEAAPAPWSGEGQRGQLAARGRKLIKLQLNFAAGAVHAKNGVLGCKKARYRPAGYAIDALFQGNLPEPAQDKVAKSLGFAGEDVPSVDVNCSTGVFSYHFRDKDTVLFAYDNVIYTMKRQ